jgi:AraC-like DNA-binding protein
MSKPSSLQLNIEYWNDISASSASPSTLDAVEPRRFSGELRRAQLDEFDITEVTARPAIVRHTRSHVTRTQASVFALKLQLEGHSVTRQDGREAKLTRGDFTLCHTLRPYEVIADIANRMLVLMLPEGRLRRYVASPEKVTAIAMSGSSGMSGLLSEFLLSLWAQYPNGADPAITPHVGQATLNLLACSYAQMPRIVKAKPSMADVHRVRVRAHVEKHLCDPDLSIATIAAACRIRERYLRKLFAEEEDTLARYILRRRLEECADKLTSQAFRAQTITDIALAQGFSNMSHFGRVFRDRYGLTPREFRSRSD